MAKSRIFQFLALLLVLIGGYMLLEAEGDASSSNMAGFGALVIGLALFLLSFSKSIRS